MSISIRYQLELPIGKTLSDLSVKELCAQRDMFARWVDAQVLPLKNADRPFMNAFKALIQYRQQNPLFLPEQEVAAIEILEHGFYFSETAKAQHKHHGNNAKGRS